MKFSLSLGQRIALGASLLILLVLFASGLGLWYARTSARSVELTQQSVEEVNRLAEMEATWSDVTATIDRMLLTRQTGLTGEQLRSQMQTFNEQLSALQADPMGVAPSEVRENEEIIEDLRFYGEELNELVDDVVLAASQRRWAQAQVLRHTELAASQRRFSESLNLLRQNTQGEAQRLVADAEAQQRAIAIYLAVGAVLAIVVGIAITVLSVRTISRPIYQLAQRVQNVSEGNFSYQAPMERDDEIGDLSRSFSMMTEWLQESYQILEERVTERTEDLALAAQVGQTLARVRDLDTLLQEAVDSIRKRFNLYYAQVYLTSEDGRSLILHAGTGKVGRELRRREFRLPVNRRSINGTAALDRHAVIIPDTTESGIFRSNPLLPDTQSEIAVPLIAGDRVVGVLDLQSDRRYELSEENLAAFEVLAGQLAIAIENALLFADVRAARNEMEEQVKRRVSESWQTFLDAIQREERIGFAYESGEVLAANEPVQESGEALYTTDITLNDEPIGAIQLQMDEASRSDDRLEMVSVVAQQVAQQVENLRLLAEAERYRLEAEAALRRLTREGWIDFYESGAASATSYVYDGRQVSAATGANGEHALKQPLQVRGEAVGELLVEEDPGTLDDDAATLVAEVAERLSAHLENLRLTQQTEMALADAERRSAELGLLNRVVTEIAGTLDLRRSLQVVVDELVSATAADQARIALLNEEGSALTVVAEHFDESRTPSAMGVVIPVEGNALTQEVIETQDAVIIEDALSSPRTQPIRDMLRDQGIQAMAIMPILAGTDVIGTVGMDILEPDRMFSEEEMRLAETVVFQAATSVQNAHLFEQVQTALAETRVLYQAGAELNRARSHDDVLSVLRRHTIVGENNSSVGVTLFDTPWTEAARPQEMEILAFWSPEEVEDAPQRFRLDEIPAFERLMRRDRHALIRDVKTDPRLDSKSRLLFQQRFNARTVLAMPMVVGGQWIGQINAIYPEPANFEDAELQRLRNLVGQAAVAVQSINLLEETSRLLESEQRQRRISDTLVRATARMMDVTDEQHIRDVIVDEVQNLVHPEQISLYEWQQEPEALRVDIRKLDSRAREVDGFRSGQAVQRGQRPDLWRALEDREPFHEPITLPGGRERQHYVVPWYVGNQVGGVIELYHSPRSGGLREEDRASIEGIVQQASVRLQNARLYEEAELRAEELAILNEMAQALTALLDVPSVLETVHGFASRLLDTSSFYIALYEEQADEITFPIFVEDGEQIDWPARAPGNGLTEHVIRERKALLIEGNAREQIEDMGLEVLGASAQSWLGVPMLFGEEVTGVIAVQSNSVSGLYSEHDQELLSAVANAAAIALQNARLFEETQQRAAETEALYQAGRRINTAESYDEILTALRDHTVLGEGATSIRLNYFDQPWSGENVPDSIETLARWIVQPAAGEDGHYELAQFSAAGGVLTAKGPVIISNVATDPRLDDDSRALFQGQLGATSVAFVPIVVGGQWHGYIEALYADTKAFPDEALRRLTSLAGQAATAIHGLRLLEQAQERARRERVLREITARVRSATDVDVIMKTAVREVSRALGRDAFVYLGNQQEHHNGDEQSETTTVKETG